MFAFSTSLLPTLPSSDIAGMPIGPEESAWPSRRRGRRVLSSYPTFLAHQLARRGWLPKRSSSSCGGSSFLPYRWPTSASTQDQAIPESLAYRPRKKPGMLGSFDPEEQKGILQESVYQEIEHIDPYEISSAARERPTISVSSTALRTSTPHLPSDDGFVKTDRAPCSPRWLCVLPCWTMTCWTSSTPAS